MKTILGRDSTKHNGGKASAHEARSKTEKGKGQKEDRSGSKREERKSKGGTPPDQ